MDWQLTTTWIMIGLALGYVGRLGLRTMRGGKGSCGGCSCAKPAKQEAVPSLIPAEQLMLRLRK